LEDNGSVFPFLNRPLDERLNESTFVNGFVPELYQTFFESIGIGGGGGRRHDHSSQLPGNKRTLSFAPEKFLEHSKLLR
jgi:hypothetical protein